MTRTILPNIGVVAVLCLPAWADGPADNAADKVRPIPPPGVKIPEAEVKQLQDRLASLQAKIDALRTSKDARNRELLPDVEVFHRAVDQAVRFDGFYAENEAGKAKQLLDEGSKRAEQLLKGQAPWTSQTGLVVRGFRSALDDTVQPYGVVVPASFDADGPVRYRCDLWFHGRGEKALELQFIHQRMTQVGPIAPADTIVVHPFGRYCNANKLAGEVDSLEALEHAKKYYRVDDDRISVRGFSMGGAAAWHFAVHYADRWFAANPGAGFSETPLFLNVFQQEKLEPSWFEQKLWRMYDCPLWAMNLHQVPTIAYSGEIDKQKQAADVMVDACRKLPRPIELTHIIGPKTAHSIHPASRDEIEARLASIAKRGRDLLPRTVHFTTYTLKYNRMHWITVNALRQHWTQASVSGWIEAPNRIKLQFYPDQNISDLTLTFQPGLHPFDVSEPVALELLDWQTDKYAAAKLQGEVPRAQSDRSWSCRLHRATDGWKIGPSEQDGLRKRHGLQGPIDDALMSSFLFVRPGGKCRSEAVQKWVDAELDHAITHWRSQMRGDARVKLDRDVTDDDIARHNLILWGDPAANSLIGKVLPDLPLDWSPTKVSIGKKYDPSDRFDSTHHVPLLVYPNPLNPDRYVVLNSSFTFREYDYLNNARQVPKLPDWAIIDIRTPPNSRYPGKIVAADFFGERWQVHLPSLYSFKRPTEADLPRLLRDLDDDTKYMDAMIDIEQLGFVAHPAIPKLLSRLTSDETDAPMIAASALEGMGPIAFRPLVSALTANNSDTRFCAAQALSRLSELSQEHVAVLYDCIETTDKSTAATLYGVIGRRKEEESQVVSRLMSILTEPTTPDEVATAATGSLRRIAKSPGSLVITKLIAALDHKDDDVRLRVIRVLCVCGSAGAPAIEQLNRLASSSNNETVRLRAAGVVQCIQESLEAEKVEW